MSRIDAGEYGNAVRALARDPNHMEGKAELRELYLATLVNICAQGEAESNRLSAAAKLGERIDGAPRQLTKMALFDGRNARELTDEELAEVIATGSGAGTSTASPDTQ